MRMKDVVVRWSLKKDVGCRKAKPHQEMHWKDGMDARWRTSLLLLELVID
jgi:hypothetical protein